MHMSLEICKKNLGMKRFSKYKYAKKIYSFWCQVLIYLTFRMGQCLICHISTNRF